MERFDSAPAAATEQRDLTALPPRGAVWFWRHARKVVVSVMGGTLLLLGVAMLVLPGPGWVTIFAALALLASEFAWARWVLKHAQQRFAQTLNAVKNGFTNTDPHGDSITRSDAP